MHTEASSVNTSRWRWLQMAITDVEHNILSFPRLPVSCYVVMCSAGRLAWIKDPYRFVNYSQAECDLFFLSRQITRQEIWIMVFKLHWNTELFIISVDELNERRIQGCYSEKYWEEECLTASEFYVSFQIIFHNKSNSCTLGLPQCSWYPQPLAKKNILFHYVLLCLDKLLF